MSMGSSKLNPYAVAYVPIAKRADNVSKLEHVCSDRSKAFGGSDSQKTVESQREEKGHVMSGFYDSLSQEYSQVAGSQAGDGQLEMDLAYLQTVFPSVSEQSLIDIYFVSGFDLDAAQEMLSQLEHFDLETPQNLPDSLDIGDVSEPEILPDFSNLKLKEVAGVTNNASYYSKAHAGQQQ